jgi:AraC-like DNA-binding protein
MSQHDLSGLGFAIHLKSQLLRALAASEPGEWPRHLVPFMARLDASLQDTTALVVLLADLREEIRDLTVARGRSFAEAGPAGRRLTAMSRDDVLAWFRDEVIAATAPTPRVARGSSQLIEDAVRFIDRHYAEPVTIGLLASALGHSKRQLVTLFRRQTGQTIHEYLTQVHMRRSMELIGRGEKIEAVSLMVGYKSRKNFYRRFKAAVGLTPLAYRTRVVKRRTS